MIASSRRGLLLLLFVLIGAAVAGSGLRENGDGALPPRELYLRTLPAVGWVLATDKGKGTGWVVDANRRLLITNYHVVGDNTSAEVQFPVMRDGRPITDRAYYLQNRRDLLKSGHLIQGRVLRAERDIDLAVLQLDRLPEDTPALTLAQAPAQPGDPVQGLGHRYDSVALWTYTHGNVRQARTLREGYFSGGQLLAKGARVLHVQMPINEGDSGGPLLNQRGEVVGVAAAVAWEYQGAGLFIDLSEVRALLDRAGGQPPPPTSPPPAERPARSVYRQVVPTLVLVQASNSERRHSGWLLDRTRRLIVTTSEAAGVRETVTLTFPEFRNGQVIAEARHYRDTKGHIRAVVLTRDARRNLALVEALRLPEQTQAVRLASDAPYPGDTLHALGNPDKIETLFLYSGGWLRQSGRANLGQIPAEQGSDPEPEVLLVQLNPTEGEGGGPVFNDHGELVGSLTGKSAAQQQIAYALPVAEIQVFLREQHARWDPRTADELVARGKLFVKARQPDRAIVDLSEALREDPDDAVACSERSRAFQDKGQLERALEDSDRAVRLQPRLSTGYSQRAAVQVQRGQARAALADCDKALQLDHNDTLALRVRGQASLLLNDLDHALSDLTDAIWLDRKSALAYLYRGRVYVRKDDLDHALADFNQAVVHDPQLAEAYRSRADLFWARSDVLTAWTDYDQALTLNPADADAWIGRGRAWSARKDSVRALADFDRSIEIAPRLASGWLERGRERLRLGEIERAMADFKRVLELQPDQPQDILAAVQRRARELAQSDAPKCCELCREMFRLLQPLGKDRPELRDLLQDGLRQLPEDKDFTACAGRLNSVIAALREKVERR
jgi:tetratricopeptide (TPR) repeat protein